VVEITPATRFEEAISSTKKRGLSRPSIPWREIEAVKERATR